MWGIGSSLNISQRVAIPPAIHIGFPETERLGSEDSVKEARVMHLYVPGASAVNANVRARNKIGHHILDSGHMTRRSRERVVPA